jgi:Flp pilus assembly protein TadG
VIRHLINRDERRASGMRARRDAGVATVEFALLFGVLMAVVALVWPLGEALTQKMAMDRAMSDVVRYATSTPNSGYPDAITGAISTRRPNCSQMQDEVTSTAGADAKFSITATAPDGTALGVVCSNSTGTASGPGPSGLDSGDSVVITISTSHPLGPLGDLLSITGITPKNTITVSAAASGREE